MAQIKNNQTFGTKIPPKIKYSRYLNMTCDLKILGTFKKKTIFESFAISITYIPPPPKMQPILYSQYFLLKICAMLLKIPSQNINNQLRLSYLSPGFKLTCVLGAIKEFCSHELVKNPTQLLLILV